MAQGMIGGMTNYEDQSIGDILEDIKGWISYTEEIRNLIETGIDILKENGYWNNIPYSFQATLLSSIRCQNTFLYDLQLVVNAIEQDKLSVREVNLMKKIGKNAIEYNTKYGISYKEESRWKEYDNKDFRVAENLYAKGRDYFVTLQDASNFSGRLPDYINTIPPSVNQNIYQTIQGNGNVVAGNNSGTMNKFEINASQFSNDIESAIEKLKSSQDIDDQLRKYITEILDESKSAVQQGDLDAQANSKLKMKSFLMGAGANATNLLSIIGSYFSIASYFQF
ncbi:hypothetical protein [Sporosarcina sp. FSL K6-3457]|uniref:hypothetical protein n=1 Tax=Sporosarcina sp. FSL K6-3457 TaxID=2978204 RepID=UPI0030FC3E3A